MPERSESAIQRPDIIHRLQQFLGLRQWSVVPHLMDGVQAVVIMGDVREVADEKVVARPCAGVQQLFSDIAGFHVQWTFSNPAGSGVVARLHELEFDLAGVRIVLQQAVTAGIAPTAFRDFAGAVSDAVPRIQLNQIVTGAYPSPFHYLAFPGRGRNWGTGWTVHPGHRLLVDSLEVAGIGTLLTCSFLWTESTLGSS